MIICVLLATAVFCCAHGSFISRIFEKPEEQRAHREAEVEIAERMAQAEEKRENG